MTTTPQHEATTTTNLTAPATVSLRRRTGAAGLLAVVALVAAVLVGAKQDTTTQAGLHQFLEDSGTRLFISWMFMLGAGLAWLVFVVGLRRLLPDGHGRDLFTAAAIAGQAATWVGASLNTAAAPPNAREVPLSVYNALGEAAHLAGAAGTAATGLALVGLAAAAATSATLPWSMLFTRLTAAAGVILILAAVVGPVSVIVLAVWQLTVSILLLLPTTRNAASPGQPVAGHAEVADN